MQSQQNTQAKWVRFNQEIEFKLAPLSDPGYTAALEKERKRLDNVSMTQAQADNVEREVQAKLMGRHLILDWRGSVQNENGEIAVYSPENARHLLLSNPAMLSWVVLQSKSLVEVVS